MAQSLVLGHFRCALGRLAAVRGARPGMQARSRNFGDEREMREACKYRAGGLAWAARLSMAVEAQRRLAVPPAAREGSRLAVTARSVVVRA